MADTHTDRLPVIREILGAAGECGDTAFIADLFAHEPDGGHGIAVAARLGVLGTDGWRDALARWIPALGPRLAQNG